MTFFILYFNASLGYMLSSDVHACLQFLKKHINECSVPHLNSLIIFWVLALSLSRDFPGKFTERSFSS